MGVVRVAAWVHDDFALGLEVCGLRMLRFGLGVLRVGTVDL
jgi:hypothetical protein